MLGSKRDACNIHPKNNLTALARLVRLFFKMGKKIMPLRQMPERHSDGLYSTFTPSKRMEPKGLIL